MLCGCWQRIASYDLPESSVVCSGLSLWILLGRGGPHSSDRKGIVWWVVMVPSGVQCAIQPRQPLVSRPPQKMTNPEGASTACPPWHCLHRALKACWGT